MNSYLGIAASRRLRDELRARHCVGYLNFRPVNQSCKNPVP